MATLGSTGKAEAQNFDNKRKLFLVPNLPIPPEIQEKHQPLLIVLHHLNRLYLL